VPDNKLNPLFIIIPIKLADKYRNLILYQLSLKMASIKVSFFLLVPLNCGKQKNEQNFEKGIDLKFI
jgi:hypothetical protein